MVSENYARLGRVLNGETAKRSPRVKLGWDLTIFCLVAFIVILLRFIIESKKFNERDLVMVDGFLVHDLNSEYAAELNNHEAAWSRRVSAARGTPCRFLFE